MGFKRRDVLEKIRIDLPNHWATGGESLWAAKLGGDKYEIRNIPFYIYDLSLGDHVVATSDSDELKPIIRRVVKRGGHVTLRMILLDDGLAKKAVILDRLTELGCGWEGDGETYYALDLPPGLDRSIVQGQLKLWEDAELLSYETCEARTPGSFDDDPDDPSG